VGYTTNPGVRLAERADLNRPDHRGTALNLDRGWARAFVRRKHAQHLSCGSARLVACILGQGRRWPVRTRPLRGPPRNQLQDRQVLGTARRGTCLLGQGRQRPVRISSWRGDPPKWLRPHLGFGSSSGFSHPRTRPEAPGADATPGAVLPGNCSRIARSSVRRGGGTCLLGHGRRRPVRMSSRRWLRRVAAGSV
jgi:hypothetical protein